MMREVAKHGLSLLNEDRGKPHTAVTAWIDTLCLPKYDEDDLEGIPELVESINLQNTGPTEASRAIRKKLKYSNIHGQIRALTLLKALVENCGPRFQTTFANERLVDRIKYMAGDPVLDPQVKQKIMDVLGSWARQFKNDPKMQLVAGLYASCGGGKKLPTRSAATEVYENQQARYEKEAADRAERKAKEKERERLANEAREKDKQDKAARKRSAFSSTATKVKRTPFNLEAEKPKIMATVGQATQSAQALINALQLVNREQESVTSNSRVQTCLEKVKADRKTVVRFIQLVEHDPTGDYIGTLLATNEQVLTSLALYDQYSKPVELDSDDEHVEQIKKSAAGQGLTVPRGSAGGKVNDDTESIRSRLSEFDLQESQVERLQIRQRARVEKVNSYRASKGNALHPDLQDLAFGDSGSSSLPPPIQPRSTDDQISHGSLSEYSDYSSDYSSGGEEYPAHRGAPPTSASSSVPPGISGRSYAQYVQRDDYAGKGKGLLIDDDEDDPFADPVEDDDEVGTPGIQGKRMEWAAV